MDRGTIIQVRLPAGQTGMNLLDKGGGGVYKA